MAAILPATRVRSRARRPCRPRGSSGSGRLSARRRRSDAPDPCRRRTNGCRRAERQPRRSLRARLEAEIHPRLSAIETSSPTPDTAAKTLRPSTGSLGRSAASRRRSLVISRKTTHGVQLFPSMQPATPSILPSPPPATTSGASSGQRPSSFPEQRPVCSVTDFVSLSGTIGLPPENPPSNDRFLGSLRSDGTSGAKEIDQTKRLQSARAA